MCKNIEFDHVHWESEAFRDMELMQHVIDNIIDVNILECDKRNGHCYTLLQNVVRLMTCNNDSPHNSTLEITINYALNNGYIGVDGFNGISSYNREIVIRMLKFRDFVNYLTTISLNRFTKFYNIQSYYDTCKTLLLIIKMQSTGNTKLPPTVIKHLIIPFVYQ